MSGELVKYDSNTEKEIYEYLLIYPEDKRLSVSYDEILRQRKLIRYFGCLNLVQLGLMAIVLTTFWLLLNYS